MKINPDTKAAFVSSVRYLTKRNVPHPDNMKLEIHIILYAFTSPKATCRGIETAEFSIVIPEKARLTPDG